MRVGGPCQNPNRDQLRRATERPASVPALRDGRRRVLGGTLRPDLRVHLRRTGKHGGCPYAWMGVGELRLDEAEGSQGPAEELGMPDDLSHLRSCRGRLDGLRSRQGPPHQAESSGLRGAGERYGYRLLGPAKNPRYTASVCIATVLRMLKDRGVLALRVNRATGEWSCKSGISHRVIPPDPPLGKILTFEQFKASGGA
jgi:hypothetical protein